MDERNPDPSGSMKLSQLQELISDTSSARLESGVQAGLQILSDIEAALAEAKTVPEIAQWIKTSNELRSQTAYRRTVVGVVGSTGAGKSSVINAVLDEEGLLPTNFMRACTAVVTEVAYNPSDRIDEKYRAEIHFISREEWINELRILLSDMTQASDPLGTDEPSSESDAGVAFHKIRSVYPFLAKDEIRKGKFDPCELTAHHTVKGLLGSVQHIKSPTAQEFLALLKKFIDSKEKTPGRGKDPDAMEYWPLIKVVKVFVRSPILASGLVLVDLPGVQDSNAARSAVASKYIEQCTGLWVVAPITRAVDDKSAQTLLGDSFKRQLQFDGAYSRVTVVCSKADDLSVTEALKLIPEGERAHQLHAREQLLQTEREKLQEEVNELKHRNSEIDSQISQLLTYIVSLRTALDRSDGRENLLVSPGAPESGPLDEPSLVLLSAFGFNPAMGRLSAAHAEKKALKKPLASQRKALRELKADLKSLNSEIKHACVKWRNDRTRPLIQFQFAEGIREMDLDNAAEENENSDSSQVRRNYDDIARKLPVFCVSSKAYQKMSGRLKIDDQVAGFPGLEDTEIPALQKHAMETADETRSATCRRFLTDLRNFLTSVHLQVVLSDQPTKLADDMREAELRYLEKAMDGLRKDLNSALTQAFSVCREVVDCCIFRRSNMAAKVAEDAAIATVNSWICPATDGGLAYQTFRATCVRARGAMDFNAALAKPFLKHLSGSWEYVFESYFPELIEKLVARFGQALSAFRLQMDKRPELRKIPSFALAIHRVKILENNLSDMANLMEVVKTGQKKANRLIVPALTEAMAVAYGHCAGESGTGCYKRIKAYMLDHVERNQGTMFRAAARKMESALLSTVDDFEAEVKAEASRIVLLIQTDFRAVVAHQDIFKALSTARDDVRNLLAQVDGRFEQILKMQVTQAPPPVTIKQEMPSETSDSASD
ncbi:33a1c8c7-d86f-4eb1-815a-97caacca19ac [Thermothielavioides terrestris]|uniref:33a1c8c7-d86f-4eb1-815a-97caacca19ac n=1 Tax=Thermothielavioides terrestris TaxID=2587410 RepID=A0A446BK60_9PEZI|nr:33a1c8c7-d86f-4eb1-815a-97caacca19ac [Thermothielavioides terrestris]